ncbi:MAG: cupin domain-containing protein [Oscillospiraceae bacterium]|jgi:mannose-6-phosphate isomerase-like protein (cupin superfamily)|nr:cupin domain-containing protein [Oscillospiraceae bacterium]
MIYTKQDYIHEAKQNLRGGIGDVKFEHLLAGDALPKNCRLYAKITLAPGSSIGEHVHEGETEVYTFIEGTGKVTDDGMPINVAAGYNMTTASGHSHSVENTGDSDLVLLAVIILG